VKENLNEVIVKFLPNNMYDDAKINLTKLIRIQVENTGGPMHHGKLRISIN
jgi:hypothetical protein